MTQANQTTALTRESSESDLRQYFNGILELQRSAEEYPVNLDDVWPLVYKQKGKAVRVLRKDFVENEDYILLSQNGKQKLKSGSGGHNELVYMLSTSCLEYFIARKVRPVFEVYRQVFHKAAQQRMPTAKELALMVVRAEEEKERLMLANKEKDREIEQQSHRLALQDAEIKKAAPKVNYYDDVLQSVDTFTTTQVANMLGMKVQALNKKLREIGVQTKQSGQYILRVPYNAWRLHSTRTQTFTHADGRIGTSIYTVWTQRGVRFISALSANDWNTKKALADINGEAV